MLIGNHLSVISTSVSRGISIVLALLSVGFSAQLWAESGRSDYDMDDDGLIEINDISDFLEMRQNSVFSRGHAKLYNSNSGCPKAGCIGYELTTDLDFQSDKTAVQVQKPFFNVLEGNGHWIRNYGLNHEESVNGLFSHLINAQIRNVKLGGEFADIYGFSNIGALAGIADDSLIQSIEFEGQITTAGISGGLVGYTTNSQFINNRVDVTFVGHPQASSPSAIGGLVGNSTDSTYIANSVLVHVAEAGGAGGIIGVSAGDTIESNFVAGGVKSQSSYSVFIGSGEGSIVRYSLSLLQVTTTWLAPKAEEGVSGVWHEGSWELSRYASMVSDSFLRNDLCDSQNIEILEGGASQQLCSTSWFGDWSVNAYKDDLGASAWDFDGHITFPSIAANLIFQDSDFDGVLDHVDAFPDNAAASTDGNLDGYPDAWMKNCDKACQQASGLSLTPIEPTEVTVKGGAIDVYFGLMLLASFLGLLGSTLPKNDVC